MTTSAEERVRIASDLDIVSARSLGRELAARLGFTAGDLALIATAISELARNILEYSGTGEIVLEPVRNATGSGLRIRAEDRGPGIADLERALQDGYSTGSGLGLGLPGVRRLMDEFEIESEPGRGTRVIVCKWV